MKKAIMEQLGLETVNKLNVKICRQRVKILRAKLKSGRVPKKLRVYASYYANWYNWMANNGGTRAKKAA